MRAAGADLVLRPFQDAATRAASLVRGKAEPGPAADIPDPETLPQKDLAS
ncbi:MAG: hypothetical protein U5L08_06585 [Xanthomonadales bacterium]|nr:hypothetical protein [Xanthomonadales bacterium]